MLFMPSMARRFWLRLAPVSTSCRAVRPSKSIAFRLLRRPGLTLSRTPAERHPARRRLALCKPGWPKTSRRCWQMCGLRRGADRPHRRTQLSPCEGGVPRSGEGVRVEATNPRRMTGWGLCLCPLSFSAERRATPRPAPPGIRGPRRPESSGPNLCRGRSGPPRAA